MVYFPGLCARFTPYGRPSCSTPRPDNRFFPALARSNINRIIKASFSKAGISNGATYAAHCYRRGAANEILRSGSSLATIMRAGGWNSGGYKAYLDLNASEEADIRNISRRPGSVDSSPSASDTSSASADIGIECLLDYLCQNKPLSPHLGSCLLLPLFLARFSITLCLNFPFPRLTKGYARFS